ncbi:hypothetical protein RIR_jg20254.t1 [Rhizophagus irregularis DAOM 181602=DAOM 197198]|nr:hypothetical protein RIR_jg20254.t1 [Rhizophagus irregularis DAOM 181602=DAOM 197198]
MIVERGNYDKRKKCAIRVNTLQVQEVDIDINGILIFILMTGIYIKILRIRAHRLLKLFDKCYTVYFLQD